MNASLDPRFDWIAVTDHFKRLRDPGQRLTVAKILGLFRRRRADAKLVIAGGRAAAPADATVPQGRP